ncbi:PTP4A3 [Bugula neritina]|uniref:PTP4A3 n=1 Tax=Bugula neritina TaxID=10212 RepID=A0A7J7JEN8_BUGNE|nr:PTP4A3 [Bugula neritina]
MLQDWSYADGQSPPVDVLNKWLNLVKARYQKSSDSCIAVHCVAVLVAIALMELGMKYEDAVSLIRT